MAVALPEPRVGGGQSRRGGGQVAEEEDDRRNSCVEEEDSWRGHTEEEDGGRGLCVEEDGRGASTRRKNGRVVRLQITKQTVHCTNCPFYCLYTTLRILKESSHNFCRCPNNNTTQYFAFFNKNYFAIW
jgi:hypothetical protein